MSTDLAKITLLSAENKSYPGSFAWKELFEAVNLTKKL